MDCVFCDIVQRRVPCHRVAENPLALAFLDIHPFTEGHCLVVPKRHVVFWHDLSGEECAAFFGLAHQVAAQLMQTYRPEFVSIYARGRRVPHAHLFVVPAYTGDLYDREFTKLERLQESSPELEALRSARALAAAADRLRGEGEAAGP